jgi:hypothetical protein
LVLRETDGRLEEYSWNLALVLLLASIYSMIELGLSHSKFFLRQWTSGQEVAVRLEPIDSKHLKLQCPVSSPKGFPYWYGSESDMDAMVMQELGPSLEGLLQSSNHTRRQ